MRAETASAEEEELMEAETQALANGGVRTSNTNLQAKLELWARQAMTGQVQDLCACFLPLDLGPEDAAAFATELVADAPRLQQLGAELMACAAGRTVMAIGGDQQTRAMFRFVMPGHETIAREVEFVCVGEDWRAQG